MAPRKDIDARKVSRCSTGSISPTYGSIMVDFHKPFKLLIVMNLGGKQGLVEEKKYWQNLFYFYNFLFSVVYRLVRAPATRELIITVGRISELKKKYSYLFYFRISLGNIQAS